MIDLEKNPSVHRFDHEAMNTVFSMRILHPERERALRAASAGFRKLDQLEACLSRYREDSDVSRINAMKKGDQLFIDEETYACLKLAMEAGATTAGLFDVTLGAQIEHRKQKTAGPLPPPSGRIELSPDRPMIVCSEPGRQIDLGGIGKGFGLDRMAEVLAEHDVSSALLSCSGSTLLAIGSASWPIVLRGETDSLRLKLCNEALSASGSGFQGAHVLHPDSTEYTYILLRAWVVSDRAAIADAYSTACLLMDETELSDFCSHTPTLKQCFTESVRSQKIERVTS